MSTEPGRAIGIADQVHEDAVSAALRSNDPALPSKGRWKTKIAFGVLLAALIVTVLWFVFLFTLLALSVRSFF